MLRKDAFTLIELMIVVAIIAIIAAIAIPGLLRAKLASNETSAIGTLKTITTSESQFKNSAIVDQDGDGSGEFGWLQELGGATNYRVIGGGLSAVAATPPFLTSVLGTTAAANGGIANKSGYAFLIYLPTGAGPALRENLGPPVFATIEDYNAQEARFAAYAWPTAISQSGNRAFAANEQGEVFSTPNKGYQNYSGQDALGVFPPPGAALVSTGGDINNLEGIFTAEEVAGDGQLWIPAGN